MATLTEVLQDDAKKRAVIEDGAVLIDQEVADKSGLSGMALKAGYKTVKKVKPGIIQEVLGMLLPEFAPTVDPHYAKAKEQGDVKAYFRTHADAIAEDLLGVTDRRARIAKNKVLKRAYEGLRPQAHKHTAQAVPRLADLITKHVG